jgi:hypothetical protein
MSGDVLAQSAQIGKHSLSPILTTYPKHDSVVLHSGQTRGVFSLMNGNSLNVYDILDPGMFFGRVTLFWIIQ